MVSLAKVHRIQSSAVSKSMSRLADFTGYEDAGNSDAAGAGIGPCSASNARPLVARLRG